MKRYSFLIAAALLFALLLPLTAAVAQTDPASSDYPNPSDTPYIDYCYGGTLSPADLPQAYVGSRYSCALKYAPACGENLSGVVFDAYNLPDGLSISSSGVISGTPTTEGTYEVEIHVSGGEHEHVMQQALQLNLARSNNYTVQLDEFFSVKLVIGPAQPDNGNGDELAGSGVPTGSEIIGKEPAVAPPQTGDSNMSWIWAVAAAGIVCVAAAAAMPRKEN